MKSIVMKYRAEYIPTGQVFDREIELDMTMEQAKKYLNEEIIRWNEMMPGIWRYYVPSLGWFPVSYIKEWV